MQPLVRTLVGANSQQEDKLDKKKECLKTSALIDSINRKVADRVIDICQLDPLTDVYEPKMTTVRHNPF